MNQRMSDSAPLYALLILIGGALALTGLGAGIVQMIRMM